MVAISKAGAIALRRPRLARLISALVAGLVLGLACVGIAGVVAYAVKARTKEIGIRRALGADASRVCALVVGELAWPVALGMTAGIALGVMASRLLAADPFYLTIADATAPLPAVVLFLLAALAAALAPASRALTIDPVRTLRHD
jgi:ABC-type antimicrobial peptide transport system permease subunit